MRQVLVIEDDLDIAQLVRMHLAEQQCEVTLVGDGAAGLAQAIARRYDLIVLDIMLPGMDGLEVCRRLRARPGYTPILMLTSKSTEIDRVLGLEMGADDYLTKPFSVLELVARVKALFRRVEAMAGAGAAPTAAAPLIRGPLTIDATRRTVALRGETVELTAKEFDLLFHFAQHPGLVYTRTQLLDKVWGYSHSGYEHTVNSHINRLRAKIERNPNEPEFIQTVWGVGYKFAEDLSAVS